MPHAIIGRMNTLPTDSLAFSLWHAAHIVRQVLAGQSLADGQLARIPAPMRPAVQDHAYQCLRQFGRGDYLLGHLLERPLAAPEIHALLLVALARLEQRPEAAHTLVDQAVLAAAQLANGRFKGLVNGVLRNYLRRRAELLDLLAGDAIAHAHPLWWLRRLQLDYPKHWRQIVAAGNTSPPMALRVNRRVITRDAWLQSLLAEGIAGTAWGTDGVVLERPVPVDRLPGFAAGQVSVQDPGAQRAAEILAPAPGSRVLDACAAPGGKAAHLLEQGDIDLLALDLKVARCRRVEENLARLNLKAQVQVADCLQLKDWWDGRPFDAVLADVPCSASGVVRRHPDIKWLRREEDVAAFARTQAAILDALWQVVRPGGKLLYATCSLFPQENGEQMTRFLARTSDALPRHEELLLPDAEHDGFFYSLVEKAV